MKIGWETSAEGLLKWIGKRLGHSLRLKVFPGWRRNTGPISSPCSSGMTPFYLTTIPHEIRLGQISPPSFHNQSKAENMSRDGQNVNSGCSSREHFPPRLHTWTRPNTGLTDKREVEVKDHGTDVVPFRWYVAKAVPIKCSWIECQWNSLLESFRIFQKSLFSPANRRLIFKMNSLLRHLCVCILVVTGANAAPITQETPFEKLANRQLSISGESTRDESIILQTMAYGCTQEASLFKNVSWPGTNHCHQISRAGLKIGNCRFAVSSYAVWV